MAKRNGKGRGANGNVTPAVPRDSTTNRETAHGAKSVLTQRRVDPAAAVKGMAPNYGQEAVPHIYTFAGRTSTVSNVYRLPDEAIRHNMENVRRMRNECGIMECLEGRQRGTALLNWHLEAEDPDSADQKDLVEKLTEIVKATPRFLEYRTNMLHALWYGRYGIGHTFQYRKVKGQMRVVVSRWTPINGDKLAFRYDDGSGLFDAEDVGIRVGSTFGLGARVGANNRWRVEGLKGQQLSNKTEPTDFGRAYFLEPWERPLLGVHRHMIEDGDYFDAHSAGSVHGIGIRSRIYWTWYLHQELEAMMLEYIERSAFGFEIWKFPAGNDAAEAATRNAAEERIGGGRNAVLFPVQPGEDAPFYDLEHIEPGMSGVSQVQELLKSYFGWKVKRYILGQVLTSESEATGLGSGVAELHYATYSDIIKYDATNLEESMTLELVEPLQRFNFPESGGIKIKFVIDTEAADNDKKMEAWRGAFDMGLKLNASDVGDLIGASLAEDQPEYLENPQFQEQPEMGGMPGMGGEMPPGMGPDGQPMGTPTSGDSQGMQIADEMAMSGGQPDAPTESYKKGFGKIDWSDKYENPGTTVKVPPGGYDLAESRAAPGQNVVTQATKAAVHYKPAGDRAGCGDCAYFRGNKQCHLVTGKISKDDTCDLFTDTAAYARMTDAEKYRKERYDTQMGFWNEEDHPRDGGKFATKEGSGPSGEDENSRRYGDDEPEDAPALQGDKPKPGETPSEYMDRMLGAIGSDQRKVGDPAAYKHYLAIWDAHQRNESAGTPEAPAEPSPGGDHAEMSAWLGTIADTDYSENTGRDIKQLAARKIVEDFDTGLEYRVAKIGKGYHFQFRHASDGQGSNMNWETTAQERKREDVLDEALDTFNGIHGKRQHKAKAMIRAIETNGESMAMSADELAEALKSDPMTKHRYSRDGEPERYLWEESKHPRGQPDNSGQFGPGGGGDEEPEADPEHDEMRADATSSLNRTGSYRLPDGTGYEIVQAGDGLGYAIDMDGELIERGDDEINTPWTFADVRDRIVASLAPGQSAPPPETDAGTRSPDDGPAAGTDDEEHPEGSPERRASEAIEIIKFRDIKTDPARFQYKVQDIGAKGVDRRFEDSSYDPMYGGMYYVWHDPEDGNDYVVNGHHRHEIADRSGYNGVVPAWYIDAPDAKSARALGALINIADDNGTALDAAKFMRDMNIAGNKGLDYLKERNVSLKGAIARDSVILSNLSNPLFAELTYERLSLPQALAIAGPLSPNPDASEGEIAAIHASQGRVLKAIRAKGRDIDPKAVREMAEDAAAAPMIKREGGPVDMFGDGEDEYDHIMVDRGEVLAAVRKQLSTVKGWFGEASKKRAGEFLTKAGVGTMNREAALAGKSEAAGAQDTFNRELRLKGDIGTSLNKIIDDAARAHSKTGEKDENGRKQIQTDAIAGVQQLLESLRGNDDGPTRQDAGTGGGDSGEGPRSLAAAPNYARDVRGVVRYAGDGLTAEEYKTWDERKVKRDHGQFATKSGSAGEKKKTGTKAARKKARKANKKNPVEQAVKAAQNSKLVATVAKASHASPTIASRAIGAMHVIEGISEPGAMGIAADEIMETVEMGWDALKKIGAKFDVDDVQTWLTKAAGVIGGLT